MTEKPYYETMYILRPDIPEEEVESHLKKYSDLLVEAGAEVLDNQMRGKRRLAYPIAKHKEGIYVQLSHQGDGKQVEVLEKAMRLSEDVIRYLTVKQNGPLPTPRAVTNTDSSEEKDSKKEAEADKDSKKAKETETNKDSKKLKDTDAQSEADTNKGSKKEKEDSEEK